jgi:hypothetical protein
MNDARAWVEAKLREEGYLSSRLDSLQLVIERAERPVARVMCIGLEDGGWFDRDDVDSAVQTAEARYLVVVPTRITHGAYERAEELRLCVTGFRELLDALKNDDDIAEHMDSQERYERRRLARHSAVASLKRKGHHAYEVRRKGRRTLTIITANEYEFTVDRLYTLLESCEGIASDLIVVTNPACRRFSSESVRAAAEAGVPLVCFNDFLSRLGVDWT